MTDINDSGSVHSRAEEFLQVFKKGAEFTQGLLKENERLRFRVLELEQNSRTEAANRDIQQLQERLQQVEAEKQQILERIGSVEQANLDFTNRYAEIEAENNLLANLYITTYQLHSTFDVAEIIRIIEEILLNLVGAESFHLYLRDQTGKLLQAQESDSGVFELLTVDPVDQKVLTVFSESKTWVADTQELATLFSAEIQAVLPLILDEQTVGVISLGRLLTQKEGFTPMDEEIFDLLSRHAAMALCTAVLKRDGLEEMSFTAGVFA